MKKLINLTPHPVTLLTTNGTSVTLNSDGVARCTQTTDIVDTLNIPCFFKNVNVGVDINITETSFGDVEGLPESTDGVYYIVSRIVRQALPDRHDLLVPNDIIRDAAGNIIGCGSLARN